MLPCSRAEWRPGRPRAARSPPRGRKPSHEMGHSCAAQDRSHRLPLADRARFLDEQLEFLYVERSGSENRRRDRRGPPATCRAWSCRISASCAATMRSDAKCTLDEPELRELAAIVRGADTGRLDLAPQAPGLLALSLRLFALFEDDHDMPRHGIVMHDALYAWLTRACAEIHGWPSQARPADVPRRGRPLRIGRGWHGAIPPSRAVGTRSPGQIKPAGSRKPFLHICRPGSDHAAGYGGNPPARQEPAARGVPRSHGPWPGCLEEIAETLTGRSCHQGGSSARCGSNTGPAKAKTFAGRARRWPGWRARRRSFLYLGEPMPAAPRQSAEVF
jgi:hypothetical protein